MQIEPGPIPTFTASAPFSTRNFAASPVAIFPTTTSRLGKAVFTSRNLPITPCECPCAVSITIASTPASTNAEARSIVSAVTPTPAATRKRPFSSLHAIGLSFAFVMSLYVIKPTKRLFLSTTGSFSILFSCNICAAAVRSVCWCVVTRFSLVITSSIVLSKRRSKRKSRFVTIPTKRFSSSTTGIPPIWYSAIIAKASRTVLPLRIVTGS